MEGGGEEEGEVNAAIADDGPGEGDKKADGEHACQGEEEAGGGEGGCALGVECGLRRGGGARPRGEVVSGCGLKPGGGRCCVRRVLNLSMQIRFGHESVKNAGDGKGDDYPDQE